MIRPIKAAARMVAPLGIPLAWRQLVDDKKRLVAALLGITFGIMLMLFQLGLYNGIMAMVVLPHNILRGELVMVSPNYEYFGSSMEFSRRRLLQRALDYKLFQCALFLTGRPSDCAQDYQPKPRVIQRPGVMSENARENAALSFLASPHHRPGFALAFGCRQDFDFICVPNHRPIWLIQEMHFPRQSAEDRVICGRNNF